MSLTVDWDEDEDGDVTLLNRSILIHNYQTHQDRSDTLNTLLTLNTELFVEFHWTHCCSLCKSHLMRRTQCFWSDHSMNLHNNRYLQPDVNTLPGSFMIFQFKSAVMKLKRRLWGSLSSSQRLLMQSCHDGSKLWFSAKYPGNQSINQSVWVLGDSCLWRVNLFWPEDLWGLRSFSTI